jgi:hypothetical protein
MSCTKSRNLIRKNDFSTAEGLHTSFDGGVDILDKVLYCLLNLRFSRRHTVEELKQNIELYISNVTAETFHRVASNM